MLSHKLFNVSSIFRSKEIEKTPITSVVAVSRFESGYLPCQQAGPQTQLWDRERYWINIALIKNRAIFSGMTKRLLYRTQVKILFIDRFKRY